MNVRLIFIKVFLDYFFIQLLNQYVNILNLITFKNKLIIIRSFEFSRILITLKRYFEITNYFK